MELDKNNTGELLNILTPHFFCKECEDLGIFEAKKHLHCRKCGSVVFDKRNEIPDGESVICGKCI